MYIEMLKNDHSTVKNMKTPRLEKAKEALIKAKMVIKNPNNANIATFLMVSDISIIMLAKRVTNTIAFIPLSKPKNLPIKPASTIKIIALTASPH
jgi:hypothetical protein